MISVYTGINAANLQPPTVAYEVSEVFTSSSKESGLQINHDVAAQVEIESKCDSGSAQGIVNQALKLSAANPGTTWGQPGVNLGSRLGQPLVNLESMWGQPEVNLGSTCTTLPRRFRRDGRVGCESGPVLELRVGAPVGLARDSVVREAEALFALVVDLRAGPGR
jgi:hypothetical protein